MGPKPARRARVAMALAVYSQPHLAVTFKRQTIEGEPEDPALVLQTYTLERPSGLPSMGAGRYSRGRRRAVGKTLKQARALHWLWTRFGLPKSNPEPMFRVLIPGAKAKLGSVGLVLRAIILCGRRPKVSASCALALHGADPPDHEQSFSPLHTFQGKYVDKSLRKAMTRSLGCSDDEVLELLDGMITVIPKRGSTTFLRHDHWRSRAISAMTGLAQPYTVATWLTEPLTINDVNWRPWLNNENGTIKVNDPSDVFDALFLPRARAMMRQLYAQLLAQLELEQVQRNDDGLVTSTAADAHLYNVAGHLRHICQPLFDWAKSDHIRSRHRPPSRH